MVEPGRSSKRCSALVRSVLQPATQARAGSRCTELGAMPGAGALGEEEPRKGGGGGRKGGEWGRQKGGFRD